MYCIEKSPKQEHHKPRKSHRNTPSFSSTLLDEIYRSIDGNDVEKPAEKPVSRNTRLVEKWTENEKLLVSRRKPPLLQNNNNNKGLSSIFSSTTSSSSDGSDTETFGPVKKYDGVSSCPPSPDDCNNYRHGNKSKKKTADGPDRLIKSKSTAIKIYTSLKKLKQPTSPGGRLTSFLNSLFNYTVRRKKPKNVDKSKGFRDAKSPEPSPTCSSAPSFSRSYLSSYSPDSREKVRSEVQRIMVREIDPPSMDINRDSRVYGQKSFYDQECDRYIGYKKPPLPPNALKLKTRRAHDHEARQSVSKSYQDLSTLKKMYDRDGGDEDDGDDGISDSSSDLFELDHLGFGNGGRYCDELPVYETTCFDRNRAIARGLVF